MKPPMPISLPSVNSYLALPVVRWPSHLASHEQGYGEDSRPGSALHFHPPLRLPCLPTRRRWGKDSDRKSTRLNSSHTVISYAVFCLKKKKHIHFTLQLL